MGRAAEPFGVGGFEIGYVTDDGLEQPQPGWPRCDARHPGGPVTHLLPHHRYVCTRHRYWVGPPDIDQPATAWPASTISSVRSDTTCGCWAATVRLPPTTRC